MLGLIATRGVLFARMGLLAVLAAPLSAMAQPSQQSNDFDGDGVQDTIGCVEGYNATNPAGGAVVVVLGSTGKELFSATGPGLNDRFARTASGWRFSAGTNAELIVTAPSAPGVGSNSHGQVLVYQPEAKQLRLVLTSQANQVFGDHVAVIPDQTGDGVGEILVGGASFANSRWDYKTFIFSGSTGDFLGTVDVVVDAIARFVDSGGLAYSRSDLNNDGVVDQDDVFNIVGLVGQTVNSGRREDLDDNGVVDALDVHLLVSAMLRGERTITASSFLAQTESDWSTAESAWSALNGSATLHNALVTVIGGGGIPGLRPCTTGAESINQQCVAQIQGCPSRTLLPGETIQLTGGAYNGPGATCEFDVVGANDGLIDDLGGGQYRARTSKVGGCVLVRLQCQIGGITCCEYCNICVSPTPTCPSGVLLLSGCPDDVVALHQLQNQVFDAFLNNYQTPTVVDWDLVLLPAGQADCEISEQDCADWFCPNGECPHTHELVLRNHPKLQTILQELQAASGTDAFRVVCVRAHWHSTIDTPSGPQPCIKCASCPISVGLLDSDGDGLMDVAELGTDHNSTDPHKRDTDGDGFCDGDEVLRFHTDPLNPADFPTQGRVDSDGDGLPDNEDIRVKHNLHVMDGHSEVFDNDFDGVPDAAEIDLGLNPLAEFTLGPKLPDMRSPAWIMADRDQDGLDDKFELRNGLNPFVRDMDGDGIPDGVELRTGTDPRVSLRNESVDSDGDGLSDYEEVFIYHSDPHSVDSDGDGLPDFFEVKAGLDPTRAFSHSRSVNGQYVPGVHDAQLDMDYDGLTNLEEFRWRTDPLLPDTDGDGVDDGTEVGTATTPGTGGDPFDPTDGGQLNDDYCWVMVTIGGHLFVGDNSGCNNSIPDLWKTWDVRNTPGSTGGGIGDGKHPRNWTVTIDGGGTGGGGTGGTAGGGPIVVSTGPNGEREISYQKLRKGTCFTVSIGSGGPTSGPGTAGAPNGIFVGILPVDPTKPGRPACSTCCCLTTTDDPGHPYPGGLLGSHCSLGGNNAPDPTGYSTKVCLPYISLRIDGDNNNGYSPPAQTVAERVASKVAPGKVVFVNRGDSDRDGVPDFADGVGRQWQANETPAAGPQQLVPLVVKFGATSDVPPAFKLSYPVSYPSDVTKSASPIGGYPSDSGTPQLYYRYSPPAQGNIRIWGGTSRDLGTAFVLQDNVPYTAEELHASGNTVTLWVEGLKASEHAGDIPISVTFSEGGCGDTVVMTVADLVATDVRGWIPQIQTAGRDNQVAYLANSDLSSSMSAFVVDGAVTDGASVCVVRLVPSDLSVPTMKLGIVREMNGNTSYAGSDDRATVGGFRSIPSPDANGRVSLPTLPITYSQAATELVSAGFAFSGKAYFVPPESYRDVRQWTTTASALEAGDETPICFTLSNDTVEMGRAPFLLRRPPLVLVHGYGGRDAPEQYWGAVWKDASNYHPARNQTAGTFVTPPPQPSSDLDKIQTRVYLADWHLKSLLGYDVNFRVVPDTIAEAIADYRAGGNDLQRTGTKVKLRGQKFAATRADVFAHSMGGQLVRFYISDASGVATRDLTGLNADDREFWDADKHMFFDRSGMSPNAWYRRSDNFGVGDIRRFIAVGSPFEGSPMATVHRDNAAHTPTNVRWAESKFSNRAADKNMNPYGELIVRPTAALDLCPGSTAQRITEGPGATWTWTGYGANRTATRWLPFPCYGTSASDHNDSNALAYRNCWMRLLGTIEDDLLIPQVVQDEVRGWNSDMAVPYASQLHGALSFRSFDLTVHTAGCTSPPISSEINSAAIAERASRDLSTEIGFFNVDGLGRRP